MYPCQNKCCTKASLQEHECFCFIMNYTKIVFEFCSVPTLSNSKCVLDLDNPVQY